MKQIKLPYVMLVLLLFVTGINVSAQTRIYKGDSRSSFDLLIEIKDSLVYNKLSNLNKNPSYVFKNNELYGLNRFQQPLGRPYLKIEKNKIIINDNFSSNVLCTIDGDNIHLGDGTFISNTIAYHVQRDKIYLGESTFNPILYTIEGDYNLYQIVCLLFLGMN